MPARSRWDSACGEHGRPDLGPRRADRRRGSGSRLRVSHVAPARRFARSKEQTPGPRAPSEQTVLPHRRGLLPDGRADPHDPRRGARGACRSPRAHILPARQTHPPGAPTSWCRSTTGSAPRRVVALHGRRPPAVARDGDVLVLGAGVTYTPADGARPVATLPGAGPGRPHGRLAPDPQRRHARRQRRHRITRRRHAARPRCARRGRRAGQRRVTARRPAADRRVPDRRRSDEPPTGRAHRRGARPRARGPQEYLKVGVRNAMVIAVARASPLVVDRAPSASRLGSVGPTAAAGPEAEAWLAGRFEWEADHVRRHPHAARVRPGAPPRPRPIDDHRSTPTTAVTRSR